MKLKVFNPDLTNEERTYLESDYSDGVSLTVRNNDGFTTNWFAVAGEPGQEQTETKLIAGTVTNNTVTLSAALKFSHPKSTPVYLCRWDKWSIERSASATGVYTAITDSPFSIEWDDKEFTTTIIDDAGSSAHYYKWRPYNSTTETYGAYSDVLPGSGLSRSTVGYAINQVKRSSLAKGIEDDTIVEFFIDFEELVYQEIPQAWWFRKTGTQVATEAETYKYSIDDNWDDFRSMNFLLYRYINGDIDNKYPLTWSPPVEFYNLKSDSDQPDDDNARYWTLLPPDNDSAKGYIGLHPTPDTDDCFIEPIYNFEPTAMDSFADTLTVPLLKGYVDYALYRIADDKLDANSEKYFNSVRMGVVALKKINRRQLGQKEFLRFRGHRGWSKQFGDQGVLDISTYQENYW